MEENRPAGLMVAETQGGKRMSERPLLASFSMWDPTGGCASFPEYCCHASVHDSIPFQPNTWAGDGLFMVVSGNKRYS